MAFRLIALVLSLAAVSAARAQMVDVRGVDFDSLRDEWVQMEVELYCEGNPLPEARDPDFVERIGVTAFLAYEIDAAAGEFDFYRAEVEIVAMEKGDSANVYFFLPGVIVERDQLPDEPYFHFVEVTVGGRALPLDDDGMGRRFRGNETAIESLRAKAAAEGSENEFILMPAYLAPVGSIGARMDDLPVYLRREPAAR